MAKFPKADTLPKGENENGFRSVGGAAYANRDPTQSKPRSDGQVFPWHPFGPGVNGRRWGQITPGQVDEQGGEHDW